MKHKDVSLRIYTDQIFGSDPEAKERGIARERDWRMPDVVIPLDELRVYVGDQEFNQHQGAIVPDWNQGWSLRDNRTSKTVFEGKGDPPEWVEQMLRDGLVLCGYLVLRDLQQHN